MFNPTEEQKEIIQYALLDLEPRDLAKNLINCYEDVIEYDKLIRGSQFSEELLYKVALIVVDLLHRKRRFQKALILKILKYQIKLRPVEVKLRRKTVDLLFEIYTAFILTSNEADGWKLSMILKGLTLRENQIAWLIEYAKESEMVLNRLLLYPEKNDLIYCWARESYDQNKYPSRNSELIAIILNTDINFRPNQIDDQFIWGISRSKLSSNQKSRLLKEALNDDTFDAFINVCLRGNFKELLRQYL